MVMEALVYILTLLFGVSTVIIIKNKRYKDMSGHHPDICWFCHHIICYFVCRE